MENLPFPYGRPIRLLPERPVSQVMDGRFSAPSGISHGEIGPQGIPPGKGKDAVDTVCETVLEDHRQQQKIYDGDKPAEKGGSADLFFRYSPRVASDKQVDDDTCHKNHDNLNNHGSASYKAGKGSGPNALPSGKQSLPRQSAETPIASLLFQGERRQKGPLSEVTGEHP